MKLIIDIPDSIFDTIENDEFISREQLAILQKHILNGIPYEERTKGDSISRKALIKWIDDSVSQYGHTYSTDMLNTWGLFKDYLINNAPAVETVPLEHHKKIKGILENEINSLVDILDKEQSQGEWIDHSEDYGYAECPFCHKLTNCEDNIDELHYCWYCGAKMKGSAE